MVLIEGVDYININLGVVNKNVFIFLEELIKLDLEVVVGYVNVFGLVFF